MFVAVFIVAPRALKPGAGRRPAGRIVRYATPAGVAVFMRQCGPGQIFGVLEECRMIIATTAVSTSVACRVDFASMGESSKI
jgi:hypothetical protein